MSVQYKANSVNVSDNIEQNLMVYVHPGDIISFEFDISALNKEIVNGDLVIHLLNGKSITVVNFGLMVLDNKAPHVEDINRSYNPFSLFGGEAYYEEGAGRYVISRVISSPEKLSALEGKELPSSKDVADGEGILSKQVGNFLTDEQSLILEFAPLVQDYITKTLQHANTKLYESNVFFTAQNQYSYNEINHDIFPIKLLIINPKITPEYGTDYRVESSKNPEHKDYRDLFIDIGGGRLKGDDFAYLMYSPFTIDLSNTGSNYWFDGPTQTNKIVRYFHIGIPTQSVLFTKVIVNGLPSGVGIANKIGSNLEVKPLGSGSFEITVRGSAAAGGVEIPIEYAIGLGGKEGIFSPVGINYEGIQAKTGDLVKGNNTVYFEFKPVHGPNDVSNFNKYNTYTFSTLRDPLIIRFGSGSDIIKGGYGDYIYYSIAGDNKAYGGFAKEEFHLGVGDNKFYVGVGNAKVDVENLSGKNSVYLSDAIEMADLNSTNTIVDNGKIVFTGKYKGVTFTSFIKNFSDVYFDVGDNDKITDRNDTVTINSTWGMELNTVLHMGNGNNIVKAGSNSILVDFKILNGASKAIFITTHNTSMGVFVRWGSGDNRIIGSLGNDTIMGYNDNESISFDGNGGINTADYSRVTVNLTYDASSGGVVKEGQSSLDKIVGIQRFIGGNLENIFYGSVYYTSFDGKEKQSNIEFYNTSLSDKSKLSYSRLKSTSSQDKKENGVIIDLTNNSVTKIKTGGVDRFHNISCIEASNNNDTFIVSPDVNSSNLNGLGGFNTVDYSKSVVQVDFVINDACSGNVVKGSGTHGVDTINNFRYFIGSTLGSTFSLSDFKFQDKDNPYRFIVEGKANSFGNKVNYSTIIGKAVVVDMRLDGPFLATLYSGKTANSSIVGVDLLINIGVFGLTNESDNIVYMYSQEQLCYVLNSGTNGKNLISFEKTDKPVSINFHGNNFNNINGFSILKLSKGNDKIVMGSNFFAQEIDGNGGINEIDFSNLSLPIISDINLEDIELTKVNIGSKDIKVKNFNRIISTASDDVFNIKFDLVNIDKIKNKEILFDGSQGFNVINFSQVKNSAESSKGLIIDISNSVLSKVTDDAKNNVLSFTGFNKIIGSQGNDVFILPVVAFDLIIDGGGGALNTVSYQAYTQGIHITEEILSRFKNIHKIIGTQGNDFVSLNESTNFHIDGFSGFNIALYNGTINSAVNIEVTADLLSVKKGNKTDVLKHIEVIDFSSSVVNGDITFNIKTLDNSKIVTGGAIYFCGKVNESAISNAKIDYSSLSSGVILNLDVVNNLPAKGFWLGINKGNSNIDYIQNIGRIVLSKNSQVNIYDSIGALTNIKKIEIDGNGSGILSFSKYNGTVFIDVSISTMKFGSELEITFLGFKSFEGSNATSFSTTFLSNSDKSYTFNGLLSVSKLSYEKVASDLNIVIKGANAKGYNEFEIKKANNSDIAFNIMHLRGAKGNTNIILEKEVNNDMTFEAESGSKSKISYEHLDNTGVLIFAINKEGVIVGRSNGLYKDKIINFSDITGSKGNSRFEIDTSVLQSSTVYNINGGGGLNTINFGNFDADVAFKMDAAGLIRVNLGQRDFGVVSNMSFIFGTSTKSNSFVLGNFFNKKSFAEESTTLTIYGNSGNNANDVLDLKDTNKGLSLDPLIGRISLSSNEKVYIMASSGVHTINLGNGDHQVDISSGVSAVGWKVINGGTGNNNISFSRLLSGITYDLSSGIKDLDFVLVNFTGVTGSRGNDTFILKAVNENLKGMRIDGFEGTLNTLDYSDLNVAMKIDIASKSVFRGEIKDIVTNMQVFKTGKGGAAIKADLDNNYQFFGNEAAIDKNLLSYEGVSKDIIFNFMTKSIVKDSSKYDSFSGISKFIGGSGNNTFLFSTEALNTYVTEVLLNGGTGKNNVVNLSRLSFGITYDIGSKFFTINYNNKALKVNLENIHQVIGTGKADIFIFRDNVNNFNANGGINEGQLKNTADLSKVTSGVVVDFANRTIVFGTNKNSFSNIEKFIGSKAGGNIFRGLTSSNSYEIDGGTSEFVNGGNTIEYSGASTGLILSVKNGNLNINKSGDLVDIFKNIHNLKLSTLSDELVFNSPADLSVYGKFKIIDGGLGDNLVSFNSGIVNTSITFNIDAGSLNIGGNNDASIKILNFTSIKFANGSGKHTVIAGAGMFIFNLVAFGATNNSTLDLTKVSENLVIGILEDGITSTIAGNTSGNRGTLINLKNLLLGNGVYSLNFIKFNSNSMKALNVKAGSSATTNLIIDQYVGNASKIDISGRNVKLDSSSFSSVSSVSILQATQSVGITFSSKLVENGTFSFYLNNSTIANSNVTLTLASSISGAANDIVAINANNNITLKSNNGDKVFCANLLTSNGSLNINYDSVKLQINTFNTSFKNISIKSSKIDLHFFDLPFNLQGIFYDFNLLTSNTRSIEIKEGMGSNSSYKINLTSTNIPTISIYGSQNSDTFNFSFSDSKASAKISIKEDGSMDSLNRLNVNIVKDTNYVNFKLTEDRLTVGSGITFDFSGTRKVNIFSFGSNDRVIGISSVYIGPSIKHVTFPKLSARASSHSFDKLYLPISEMKEKVSVDLNFSTPSIASGSVNYGVGCKFSFDNFYVHIMHQDAYASVSSILIPIANPSAARGDIFKISGKGFQRNVVSSIIIFYVDENYKIISTSLATSSTIDLSKWDIFDRGFELCRYENKYKLSSSNSEFNILFSGMNKILLGVTDATTNIPSYKNVITLDDNYQIDYYPKEKGNYFSFGNLNEMRLPSKYRILACTKNIDFEGSNSYPIWERGDSTQGRNTLRYYDTYNNVFEYFTGNSNEKIYVNLNMNSNNESTFNASGRSATLNTIAGANLFWVGRNNNEIITVKVYEISRAKPFALMLHKNVNNIIDLSEVKDNQDYLFRFIYGALAREDQQVVTITNLPKTVGTFPLDDSLKVYGSFAGAKKVILTSAKNTLYIPAGMSDSYFNNIDGGPGFTTFSFTGNLGGEVAVDFTTGEGKGFNVGRGLDSINKKTLYTNVKVIENGYQKDFSKLTVRFALNLSFQENFNSSFIVRQPKNLSGEYVNNLKPIEFINSYASSVPNVFLNNRYILFSSRDLNINFSIMGEDFAVNSYKGHGANIFLGLKIDFQKMVLNKSYERAITMNLNTTATLIKPQHLDYTNYTLVFLAKSIVLKDRFSNTFLTLTFPNGFTTESYSMNPGEFDEENGTTMISYYEFLAANPLFELTEGNNAYRTPQDAVQNSTDSAPKIVAGATVWTNQFDFESSLTVSVVDEQYWKDLDSRIKNAFLEEDDKENKKDIIDNINAEEDSFVKQYYEIQKELAKTDSYEEDNSNSNHSSNTDDASVEYIPEEIASNDSTSTEDFNGFDLNSILEAAKSITEDNIDNYNNHSTELDAFSVDLIPIETIENTFMQDEANSMSYTIDTTNSAMSSFHSSLDGNTDSSAGHEQHKNKHNY